MVSYSPPAIPTAVVLIAPESAPDVGIGATTLPDVTQHTATYGNEAHFVTEWQLMEVLAPEVMKLTPADTISMSSSTSTLCVLISLAVDLISATAK